MTITEVKNQLISHFQSNSVLTLDSVSFKSIELDKETENLREQVIRAALEELETIGMVKKLVNPTGDAWILTQSFGSFTQQVTLSPHCAEWLANTLNQFREANEMDGDECDKTRITEKDIVNLLEILHTILEIETNQNRGEAE